MIAALEGPTSLTACSVHPGNCAQESSCEVREPWQRINASVREALSKISLADLAAPSRLATVISLHSLAVDTESAGSG